MEFNTMLKTLTLLFVVITLASAMPHGGHENGEHSHDHEHERGDLVPEDQTLVRKSRQYYGGPGYGGYGHGGLGGFGGSSSNAFAAANSGSYGGGFGYPGFGGSSSNAVAAAGSNSFGKK